MATCTFSSLILPSTSSQRTSLTFRAPSSTLAFRPKRQGICCRASAPSDESTATSSEVTASPPQDESLREPQQQQQRRARGPADSTDWIASSLTRRFGLGAGLAWVGFLAFGVISEQIKTRTEVFLESQGTRDVESEEEVLLPNGIRYVDVRKGGGASPYKGDLVVVDITGKDRSTGEVFVDTNRAKRPLAFVFLLKPYAGGVCDGVELAMASMKAGGIRRVIVPPELGFGETGAEFGDVKIPGGEELEYVVQLQKVSIAPS